VAYHTALVLQAGRPFPVHIRERTVVARPISVPVMLQMLSAFAEATNDGLQAATQQLLRAAFPRPRLGWRDPLRAISALSDDLQLAVVHRLMRMPDIGGVVGETDAASAIAQAQRAAATQSRSAHAPRPTLLLAAQACRAQFGESWYFDPRRWATVDGYVPHDVCWVEYTGLMAIEARRQLREVSAAVLAQGGDKAKHDIRRLVVESMPLDPITVALQKRGAA